MALLVAKLQQWFSSKYKLSLSKAGGIWYSVSEKQSSQTVRTERELKINVRISYFTVSFEEVKSPGTARSSARKDFVKAAQSHGLQEQLFSGPLSPELHCTAVTNAEILLNDGQWYQLEKTICPGPSLHLCYSLSTAYLKGLTIFPEDVGLTLLMI